MNPEVVDRWMNRLVWGALALQLAVIFYIVTLKVDLSAVEWSAYINSWLALAWTRTVGVLGVILLVSWCARGHTIRSILTLEETDPWQEKMIAGLFLLGMGYLTLLCMRPGDAP